MLVESGLTRITGRDGREYTFRPSFARIAELGSPPQIIQCYAGLYEQGALAMARYVMATMADDEDVTPLIGWLEPGEGGQLVEREGDMAPREVIIIARHLMRHGVVGRASTEKGEGRAVEVFDVEEYVASARVHLGLSTAEAMDLSMTELWRLFDMKFPDAKKKKRDVPTREEYRAAMAALK